MEIRRLATCGHGLQRYSNIKCLLRTFLLIFLVCMNLMRMTMMTKNNQPSAAMTVNNRPTRVATARAVHRRWNKLHKTCCELYIDRPRIRLGIRVFKHILITTCYISPRHKMYKGCKQVRHQACKTQIPPYGPTRRRRSVLNAHQATVPNSDCPTAISI